MDIEKLLSGLIGGAITGVAAIGTALVSKGKRDAQFERLGTDVAALEKSVSEKVSLDRFEKEIKEIHGQMSLTQREQAAAIEKLESKVDGVSGEVKFMSGVMSQIPGKLDALAERIREAGK